MIGNLITDARCEDSSSLISQLGLQFTVQTQGSVPLITPVIGQIIRRVLNHPDTDCAKFLRPPDRRSGLAAMSR